MFGGKFVDAMVDLSQNALAEQETSDTEQMRREHISVVHVVRMGWGLYSNPWACFGVFVVA